MRIEHDGIQPFDEIVKTISEVNLVSFDLLGTLVDSDFTSSEHLFQFIEERARWPDFAVDRDMAAQVQAALNPDYPGNWTLDDIYRDVRGDPDVERTLLAASLTPARIGRILYEAAQAAGIPMVVAVDGPLGSELVRDILVKNEFFDIKSVYVSSEAKRSKQKYTTFRKILSDYNLAPSQVLHVGSNSYNDVAVPADIGMHAALLLPPLDALIATYPLFSDIAGVLGRRPSVENGLLLRTIQRALLRCLDATPSGDPGTSNPAVAKAVLFGPLIASFFYWIRSWLSISGSDICLVAGPPDSPFSRLFTAMMNGRAPEIEVIAASCETIREEPVRFRDLDAGRCGIVSLDGVGRGAGTLVARNPVLAVRPSLHFALSADARRSRQDHCFFGQYGLPANLTAAVDGLGLVDLLFESRIEEARSTFLGSALFMSEWDAVERRYPGVRVSRDLAVAITLAAAAGGPAVSRVA